MKTQSASLVIPAKGKCMNRCKFCVAHMHEDKTYENFINEKTLYYATYLRDYMERLNHLHAMGCSSIVLTGDAEPQQNWDFLKDFGNFMEMMRLQGKGFENIDIQTTGSGIDDSYLHFLRTHVGVKTVSLSVSSFNDDENNEIIGTNEKVRLMNESVNGRINLKWLCGRIKIRRFNLRLSINLTSSFEHMSPKEIMAYARDVLGANQITFRVLYKSTEDPEKMTPQDRWIQENACSDEKIREIQAYIKKVGRFDRKLQFGQDVYFCHDMSTVIDDDCMDAKKFRESDTEYSSEVEKMLQQIINTEKQQTLKYLILRQDGKLYSNWDSPVAYF